MSDSTKTWQIRCTKCGRTRDASEVGVVRHGAASFKKFTWGWCSQCRWFRSMEIEKKPTLAEAAKK